MSQLVSLAREPESRNRRGLTPSHCRYVGVSVTDRERASRVLPAPRAGFDPNEYLVLLGTLGILVGVALATSAEPTG